MCALKLDSNTSSEPSMAGVLNNKLGPHGYGGTQGTANDINSNSVPKFLKDITVWSNAGSDGRINAISFIYFDKDNVEVKAGSWGTKEGVIDTLSFGRGEYLTKLSATIANDHITSLTFYTTNKSAQPKTIGKNPTTNDKTVPIEVGDNESIVAFFGRSDFCLRANGVYSAPQAYSGSQALAIVATKHCM